MTALSFGAVTAWVKPAPSITGQDHLGTQAPCESIQRGTVSGNHERNVPSLVFLVPLLVSPLFRAARTGTPESQRSTSRRSELKRTDRWRIAFSEVARDHRATITCC